MQQETVVMPVMPDGVIWRGTGKCRGEMNLWQRAGVGESAEKPSCQRWAMR